MTIYDFSIAAESFQGEYTKKEGDIINYLPHPSQWGNVPLRNCLIIPIDNIPENILQNLLAHELEDGSFQPLEKINQADMPWVSGMERIAGSLITEKGRVFIAQNSGTSSTTYPEFNLDIESETIDNDITWKCKSELPYQFWRSNFTYLEQDKIIADGWVYQASVGGLSGNDTPVFEKTKDAVISDNEVSWTCIGNTNSKMLALRRFKISLEDIKNNFYPDLDLNRVRDINDQYQPLIDNDIVIDYLGGTQFIYDKFIQDYI